MDNSSRLEYSRIVEAPKRILCTYMKFNSYTLYSIDISLLYLSVSPSPLIKYKAFKNIQPLAREIQFYNIYMHYLFATMQMFVFAIIMIAIAIANVIVKM